MDATSSSPPPGGSASLSIEPPILEARGVNPITQVAPPPPRFSRSSSSSSSSTSGSTLRLGAALVAPSLRRSQVQDNDPCMLGTPFEGWSDEDEKKEEHGNSVPLRPVVQRSQTEKSRGALSGTPAPTAAAAVASGEGEATGSANASSVAALFIRVRKLASTSALELGPPPMMFQSSPERAVPAVDSLEGRQLADMELASVLEEGDDPQDDSFRERDNTLHQGGRCKIDQLTAQHSAFSMAASSSFSGAAAAATGSRSKQKAWYLAWTSNSRWYGRILNSYFAFWLVVCSLVIALLEMVLLAALVVLRNEKLKQHGGAGQPWCHMMTRGGLKPIHYIGVAACVALALPVIFPIDLFTLYKKRADSRMIRRPYLHICEVFVSANVVYLTYFVITEGYHLPDTVRCHQAFTLAEMVYLYSTALLWVVLWWQLVVFCRFLVHLKLQADAANDATHTSALSDWLKPSTQNALTLPNMRHRIQRFKKLLYRAAARGDSDAVDELVSDASLQTYGIASGQGVRDLYAKSPTLWLYAFASSAKNPLHIAAKRGHVAVVAKLLELDFDANALDKVARINFNLGLLFKIVTQLFLKTQDGSKSLLRALLCSVLLPPLHGAVASGHVEVVRLLLEKGGVDPNVLPRVSFYHSSAAIPAIFLADDPEIVKMLVSKGANFLHVAPTALSGLASSTFATPLQRSALTLRSATTEYLLSCGGDVALTPLHEAAAADNVRKLKLLLRQRPRLSSDAWNSVDSLGERVAGVQLRTPLHWAAVVGRLAAARVLLERGANPNARDRYGRTPLHWAARNNHTLVVALLLDHGADATTEDDGGIPVLSFAAEAEGVELEVFSSLLDQGASLKHQVPGSGDTPLHIALLRENRETAKSLIRCGADLMAANNDGKRAVDVTTSTRLQFELKKEAGTRDIMISYPHSHFALAQRVREYLEIHGKLTCWMDTMDPSGIGGGAVWREEIARGIHNCSLVVSVVCGGYTKSEWCLKELALAKMIRKPVVALIVEHPSTVVRADGDVNELSAFDALVPEECRVSFNGFLKATRDTDKSVDMDVDAAAFDAASRTLLPQLRNAMQPSEHSTGRRFRSGLTTSSRLTSKADSEPEREDEDDGDTMDDETKEDSSDQPSRKGLTTECVPLLSVVVYSPLAQSVLRDRVVRDLAQRGFQCHSLELSSRDADSQVLEKLAQHQVLVVVVESLSFEATREQRQDASTQLTRLLRLATATDAGAWPRVFPVVARDEFLSFSNLYTLARSELLYYVGGVRDKQSTTALLRQLRRAVANERKRHVLLE